MIEYEHSTENQYCVCTSDKLVSKIYIEKEAGGFKFFVIRYENGTLPNKLSGRYSSIPAAQRAIENYLRNQPPSKTLRRNENAEARRKRKLDGSKSNSESSK